MKNVVECYGCGAFVQMESHPKNTILKCPRCDSKLELDKDDAFDSLYYAISALLLFATLNIFPLITLYINDSPLEATLFGSIEALAEQNFYLVAIIVFFTTVFAPVLNSVIIVLVYIQKHTKLKFFTNTLLHDGFHFFKHWGFVEVFILGVIVTYIKLAGMVSTAKFDIGFYAMLAYMFCLYMSNIKFDDSQIFED